jgi:hypothetical protein
VSERFKEHAWRACVRLDWRTVGSNPTLSAKIASPDGGSVDGFLSKQE